MVGLFLICGLFTALVGTWAALHVDHNGTEVCQHKEASVQRSFHCGILLYQMLVKEKKWS